MDNFMSKLSQKINAQDTIKANLMADAAEKEQMKKQLEEYATLLQDMRGLYAKQEESLAELKEAAGRSDEFTHKECVKVYRNVQALLEKQDALLEEKVEKLQASIEGNKGKDLSEDFDEVNATTEKNTKDIKILLIVILFLTLVNTSYLVASVVTNLLNANLF